MVIVYDLELIINSMLMIAHYNSGPSSSWNSLVESLSSWHFYFLLIHPVVLFVVMIW